MNKKIRFTALILSFILCFSSLISCSKGKKSADEGTKADTLITETSQNPSTDKPLSPVPGTETEVVVIPEDEDVVTYTVPHRFEINGVLQWEYTYSPDGLSFSRTDYTEETPITYTVHFDEEGNPLYTEWLIVVNDQRTELWRDDYYLDEDGRIVDEKRFCEGQIQNAYTYTYEESGAIATQQSRDVKQQNITYRLLYDEMGTHVATRFSKYNGEHGYYMEEKTCTYDENGRITSETSPSVSTQYIYIEKEGYLQSKKVVSTVGEYTWSYTYDYTYEDGSLVLEECIFDGKVSDTKSYTETEFAHYADAEKWIFRERLP